MSHHVSSIGSYLAVFTALLVLTVLTWWVAFIDLGLLNNFVALGIAVTKAVLVILYFMHVRYGTRLTWLVVASGFVWLGILFLLTMQDYLTRFSFLEVLGK